MSKAAEGHAAKKLSRGEVRRQALLIKPRKPTPLELLPSALHLVRATGPGGLI
jgi:hypothetical protein